MISMLKGCHEGEISKATRNNFKIALFLEELLFLNSYIDLINLCFKHWSSFWPNFLFPTPYAPPHPYNTRI